MRTKKRQVKTVVAGLPEHVMDELVDDLADAVVAMLLRQATGEMDNDADESSHLRQI